MAFLAAASVGAVWAVCNPDLAIGGVTARLGQLEPTVLVVADGTVYGGKRHDKRAEIAEIRGGPADLEGDRGGASAGSGESPVGGPPGRRPPPGMPNWR